jgi:hypothetical protein
MKPVCKEKIRPEYVYPSLVSLLRGGDGVPENLPEDVSCYRSSFDEVGCLNFERKRPSSEDQQLGAYKDFWHGLLEDRPFHDSGVVTYGTDPEDRPAWNRLEALLKRSSRLMQGIGRAVNEPGAAAGQLEILSENLSVAEKEVKGLALEAENLAPLIHFLFLRREALSVRDPLRFLQDASHLYLNAAEQIKHRIACDASGKEAISHG